MEGQISRSWILSAHLPATPARRMHQRRLATDRHRQTGHAGPGRRIPKGLIPSNRTTRIASLIPLQGIGQHTGVGTDREVIRSKRTEHQSATHIKAVQVTGNVQGCHRHLLGGKVVSGRISHVPTAYQS